VSVQSGQDSPLERVTNNPRKGGGQVNAGHRPRLCGSATCRGSFRSRANPRKGGVHRFSQVLGGSGAVLVVVGGAATLAKSTQN